MKIRLQHIHMVSKDKHRLALWYRDHLGFLIQEDLEMLGEPDGPVLITGDEGFTSISIFTREKPGPQIFPAFETTLDGFIGLYRKFEEPRVYDHFRFFSFYVRDADGTKIEICSTEYLAARDRLLKEDISFVLMTPETYTP